MRKAIYTFIAGIALSVTLFTGCSEVTETPDAKTNLTAEIESNKENSSYNQDSSGIINTTISGEGTSSTTDNSEHFEDTSTTSGNQTSLEDNSSSEETTTATQTETTTQNNNSGNSSNKNNSNSSNNMNNSSSSNNSSSNNNVSSNKDNGTVLADKNSDKIVISYGGSTSSEATKLAQAAINKIITKGMSDFEKAKAIHDYMVMNIDYDYANYRANTIPSDSYTALGALKNKYAVCAGYAKTFKLLCELAGLECTYVTGTAGGPHAWNQVKVDGKWYNVDVTWDDPVSTDKAFDDHKYNRYSYFLISDELMYKDHKAHNAMYTCSSSLNTKAYEYGAPWLESTYTYVKTEAELSAVAKKAVESNSTSISIMWDTNWIKLRDMSNTIKGMMLEYALNDFYMSRYTYVNIPNSTFCSCTFTINLKDGSYTAIDKLRTAEDIKKLILELKKGKPDQLTVPMDNELVSDDIFYKVAVWAFDEHDLSIGFHVTEIPINSSTKAVHVYASKNDYHGDHHANEAYRVKTVSEILNVMAKYHNDSYNNSFRIVYRYGDELGRLTSEELDAYINKNLAPKWATEYCYESYNTSTDDFVCVTVITFHNPRHSTKGMKWEYTKEPTCIEGGISTLKCGKCGNITSSHEVEATGVHDTYWVNETDTSKHICCKNCTYTGPTLYKFGDVWGYFDDTAAADLFYAVNKQRETATHYNIDPFGNLLSIETPPQLVLDSLLTSELHSVVLEAATVLMGTGGWNFDYNIVITYNESSVSYACSSLTYGSSQARNHINNKYLTRAGVCCFYFDKDGTGNKLVPIWSIYYGE